MNEFCAWYLRQLADVGNMVKNDEEIPSELRMRIFHCSQLPELFNDETKTVLQDMHNTTRDVCPDQVKVAMSREYGTLFHTGWAKDETHVRICGINGTELFFELDGRTWSVVNRYQA